MTDDSDGNGNDGECSIGAYCMIILIIFVIVGYVATYFVVHPMDMRNQGYEKGYYEGFDRACEELGMTNESVCLDPPPCRGDLACVTAAGLTMPGDGTGGPDG